MQRLVLNDQSVGYCGRGRLQVDVMLLTPDTKSVWLEQRPATQIRWVLNGTLDPGEHECTTMKRIMAEKFGLDVTQVMTFFLDHYIVCWSTPVVDLRLDHTAAYVLVLRPDQLAAVQMRMPDEQGKWVETLEVMKNDTLHPCIKMYVSDWMIQRCRWDLFEALQAQQPAERIAKVAGDYVLCQRRKNGSGALIVSWNGERYVQKVAFFNF